MSYRFTVECPGCGKTSDLVNEHRVPGPSVSCGDCLMDRVEVVHMKVVKVEPVKRKVTIGIEQEPRVRLTLDLVDLPDLLRLPDGSLCAFHGKYASPGERYSYRRMRAPVDVADVRDWPTGSKLED